MRRLAPAVALFFLAPFVAEFLLGDFPVTLLPALVVLAPLYGGGALLVRETVRRRGLGWPSIVLLALAYSVVEEGLLTQSLFNPDYAGERLLDPGYVPWLGIGLPWTLYVIPLHVVWSIGAPVAVVESLTPDRAAAPWLGRVGYPVTAALLLLGAFGTFQFSRENADGFMAPWPRLAAVGVLAAVLVVLALRLPGTRRADRVDGAPAPSAVVVGIVALVAASAFHLSIRTLDVLTPWGGAALMAVLLAGTALLVVRWSGRPGWSGAHRAALGCAALLTYAWHGFVQAPLVETPAVVNLVSDVLFAAVAVALVAWVVVRSRGPVRAARDVPADPGAVRP